MTIAVYYIGHLFINITFPFARKSDTRALNWSLYFRWRLCLPSSKMYLSAKGIAWKKEIYNFNHFKDDKANLMGKPHARSAHAPLPPWHPFVHGSQALDS